MQKPRQEKIDFQDSPVVWFCTLERARQDNNFELAAKARQELERLGVIIKYRKAARGENNDR